jgi:hypothetical protein
MALFHNAANFAFVKSFRRVAARPLFLPTYSITFEVQMSESFHIVEPLTTRLRGLLKEYPPGISILKELLQNADDAKASTVVLLSDKPLS